MLASKSLAYRILRTAQAELLNIYTVGISSSSTHILFVLDAAITDLHSQLWGNIDQSLQDLDKLCRVGCAVEDSGDASLHVR